MCISYICFCEFRFPASKKPHTLRNKGKAASSSYDHVKVVNRTSTTEELVQLLRQQASTQNNPPHSGSGTRKFLLVFSPLIICRELGFLCCEINCLDRSIYLFLFEVNILPPFCSFPPKAQASLIGQ